MHFKSSFELRDICGEKVLIANGVENIDFGALVHLNSTAADIFTHFSRQEFSLDDAIQYVVGEYDIDTETAEADINKLIKSLTEVGIIE